MAATRYRCPRCRYGLTLYVTPSEPPVCSHEPESGYPPERMEPARPKENPPL